MIGEKRLKEIRARLMGVLKDVAPESAGEYEILYRASEEDTATPIDPAYGLYLSLKSDSDPRKSYKVLVVNESEIRRPIPPI